MSSLKKTAISSIVWVFAQRFASQGINFVVSILLARVLMPAEYGLIGMISIFIAIGNIITDAGFTSSLIRTNHPDDLDYSTVFTTNLFGSLFVYLLIFFTAPLVASFYQQTELTNLLRVLSLNILISSFSSIQSTRLTRAMAFKRLTMIQVPSNLVTAFTGIVMAYTGFGVWSLVFMQIAGSIASTVQLWAWSDWRPSLRFSRAKFRQHFSYGVNLAFSGILNTLFDNAYNIIIGKYFSPASLGFFTRAHTLKQLPVDNISSTLNKVTFPLFAQMQNDDERLRKAYEKIMQQVTFWLTPLLTGMVVLAEPLFRLLFTERWLPAVPYFQIIGLTGVLYSLSSYNLNILKVKGKTRLFFKLEIAKKVIVVFGILIAFPYGIYGLLVFQTINSILSYFLNAYFSGRYIGFPVSMQFASIARPIFYALIMGAFVWFIDQNISAHHDIYRLMVGGISGASLYFLLNYFSKEAPAMEFYETFIRKKLLKR